MGGLLGAIEALLEITTSNSFGPDDVEHIDVDLSEPVYHHGWWPPERPLTPTAAQMNIGYALAVTLLDGAALAAQFSPTRIDADDVWAVIPRVTAHHRAEYDALGGMGKGQTEVRVALHDGTVHSASRFAATAILEPLTGAAVVDKFRQLTDGVIDPARQDRLVEVLTHLEDQPDLDEVCDLLRPTVTSPFESIA